MSNYIYIIYRNFKEYFQRKNKNCKRKCHSQDPRVARHPNLSGLVEQEQSDERHRHKQLTHEDRVHLESIVLFQNHTDILSREE